MSKRKNIIPKGLHLYKKNGFFIYSYILVNPNTGKGFYTSLWRDGEDSAFYGYANELYGKGGWLVRNELENHTRVVE